MTRFNTYREDVKRALEGAMVPLEGGPLDGVLMLSMGVMQQVLAAVEVPPPDEQTVEVQEPATIHMNARCHSMGCGMTVPVTGNIESYTKARAKGTIVGMLLISQPVVHVCGQTRLPFGTGAAVPGQTEAWDIGALTDPTAPTLAVDALVALLARVYVTVTPDVVDGWNEPEREAAQRWAVAHHVDPETAVRPDHVPEPHEPSFIADLPAGDGDILPEPPSCAYAGCVLYQHDPSVAHEDTNGKHIGPKPKRARKVKAPAPLDVTEDRTPEQQAADGDAPADDAPEGEERTIVGDRPDVPDVFADAMREADPTDLADDGDLLPD